MSPAITELEPVPNAVPRVLLDDNLNTTNPAGSSLELSRPRGALTIATVAGVSFLNTLGSGILTVGLPRIASDLSLAPNLLLWPALVFALTAGCTLRTAGAVADVVGNRPVFLTGALLLNFFTLGWSLAQTGTQLIVFRALQGIAISFCMPTAVSLITHNFPPGKRRNFAFAFLGGGQPIGYTLGLVLGAVLVDSIGWRYGYYISCVLNALIFIGAFFSIPSTGKTEPEGRRNRLLKNIDWIGVFLASVCIALLSYVFAVITSSTSRITHLPNIAMLAIAIILLPSFVILVGRQEKLGKPAIIPNSIWRKPEFPSICITVFLGWAQFNAFSYFVTLLLPFMRLC